MDIPMTTRCAVAMWITGGPTSSDGRIAGSPAEAV